MTDNPRLGGEELEDLASRLGLDPELVDRVTRDIGEKRAEAIVRHNSASGVATLRLLCARLNEANEFAIGDIVQWKTELRNKSRPAYGQPAIILEVKDPPEANLEDDSGSPYFREPLDIVIGFLDAAIGETDQMLAYHVDGRRLEHHPSYPAEIPGELGRAGEVED